ncbi:MAG TPA: hypothetical protein VGW57_04755 [Chthoniobacterales bacterium]|nr:hypothetical protein [Chthoniobacterales bacterium]
MLGDTDDCSTAEDESAFKAHRYDARSPPRPPNWNYGSEELLERDSKTRRLRELNRRAHLREAAFGGGFGDGGAQKFVEVYFSHEFGREFLDERAGLTGDGAAEFRPGAARQRRPANAIAAAEDAAKCIGYRQDALQMAFAPAAPRSTPPCRIVVCKLECLKHSSWGAMTSKDVGAVSGRTPSSAPGLQLVVTPWPLPPAKVFLSWWVTPSPLPPPRVPVWCL